MRFDKLTIKAQEALSEAQSKAASRGHSQIEPAHLLQARLLVGRESLATREGPAPVAVLLEQHRCHTLPRESRAGTAARQLSETGAGHGS